MSINLNSIIGSKLHEVECGIKILIEDLWRLLFHSFVILDTCNARLLTYNGVTYYWRIYGY
jgi:hypothetical protein